MRALLTSCAIVKQINYLRLGIVALLVSMDAYAALPFSLNDKELPSLAPMLEKVTPAVVNVSGSTTYVTSASPLLDDPFFQHFFGLPGEQREQIENSAGSGVIIDADKGYVVTNHHVVKGSELLRVTLADGREVQAKFVGSDPETDIALIQIDAAGLTQITAGDSDELRVGDFVVAIGNPYGVGQSVTSGIVSALGRSNLGIEGYEDFIQTDASINPGNSGGALVNLRGELIGINTAILAPSGGNVGIGFAIPVNMINRLLSQLIEHGNVQRGLLGVVTQDLTTSLAQAFDIPGRQGAVVTRVLDFSPAQEAGIAEGDVIVQIDKQRILDAGDLRNAIGLFRVGEKARIHYLRDGQSHVVGVTIKDPNDVQPAGVKLAKRLSGAHFLDIMLNTGRGRRGAVLVSQIERHSPAWQVGLRESDMVTSVNQVSIESLDEMRELIKQATNYLSLGVRRDGEQIVIRIE